MNSGEYEALRKELDTVIATLAGQTAVLSALIQTHPDHKALQLSMTTAVELMLNNMPPTALSDAMKEKTRAFVEELQRIQPGIPGRQSADAILKAAQGGN